MSLTSPEPSPTPSRRKLSAGEVAQLLDVSTRTVRRWADAGLLDCTRTLGGDRRFDADYIDAVRDRLG